MAAVAVLRALERSAIFVVAFTAVREERAAAIVAAGAMGLLYAARGAAGASLVRATRAGLVRAVVDALLGGDVLVAAPLEEEDAVGGVFEGLHHAERLYAEHLPALAGDAVASVGVGCLVAASMQARTIVTALVAMAVGVVVLERLRGAVSRLAAEAHRAYMPIYDDVTVAVLGRIDVVATGSEGALREAVDEHLRRWRVVAARSGWSAMLAGRAPTIAAVAVVAAAMLADHAVRGSLVGAAPADIVVAASVVPALLGASHALLESVRCRAQLAPLRSLLEAPRCAPRTDGRARPPRLPAAIEWHGVAFAYPARDAGAPRPALRDVSISWSPGDVLVLRGANGSGKSTLLRMLVGLAEPSAGAVDAGGTNLFACDLTAWRRSLAYLPQRPYLPDRATVREAIRLIERDASDDAMADALRRVGLWDALSARAPADPLSVRVGSISAGQRQRVALARALCRAAPLVILDEPDANLDREGVALVARLVRDLAGRSMVIAAAHTQELVDAADVIADFDDGRVAVSRGGAK